ncbi:flavodoxin family protein [Streptomyces armeniacus]|uniref:Flavodoxin family protein n=1 Tax=Streptomyces armeniacus TaxID=83291 RepID=A0A345XKT6_9ACTN|nr:NAD(P)H-dependent oxidoreductase [Streptomyces armeniacus]AXK32252.1 flavodoxin family protein [Streptomyces armeniacus]
MKVLWIFAHPEQRSLNASLMAEGLRTLRTHGHEHRVSDLYAMGWKPVIDADDVRAPEPSPDVSTDRLVVGAEQERAYVGGTLSDDIRAEQEKIAWADTLVFHFPLWWFGPPAILKGWFDRVLVQGFAFGIRDAHGRTRRYGDGGLAGKRALIVTSVGARESGFGPRGIHGQIDEVLFPMLHGTFWYTGMEALPPLVVYGADRAMEADAEGWAAALRERLRTLPDAEPIPYRREAGGDYDADLVLHATAAPGHAGLSAHVTPCRRGQPGASALLDAV